MRFLRTNTAVIVTVGPFYDKTDGVTIETALTISNERITLTADTDAGSAPTNILDNVTGATSGTANDLNYITGNDAGMMQMELAAADTNRLGRMFLSITDAANHVPVFHEFMVLPAMIYDAFVLGTDVLDASMTQILGTAVSSPATAGVLDCNVKAMNNVAATSITTISANQGTTQPINFTGTGASANVKSDLTQLKTQTVTCGAGVTVLASVGTAATSTAQTGDSYALANGANGFANIKTDTAAVKVKTDYLPSATAGAAGGVFIAGSNAATSITTALTANITGNLSGAVGSVASGGIAAASFAAGAINAAAIADAAIDNATFAADVGSTAYATNTIAKAVEIANVQGNGLAIKTMTDKIGTVTNTGGTASIGAILGDFANSTLVTRVGAGAGQATELAKVPKSDSTVSWNATALAAINAECDTALSDYDAPTKTEMDSAFSALSSHGDSTWATSTLSAAGVWAATNATLSLSYANIMARLYRFLNNKMNITDANGAVVLYDEAGTGSIATQTISDDSTDTLRTALTWA